MSSVADNHRLHTERKATCKHPGNRTANPCPECWQLCSQCPDPTPWPCDVERLRREYVTNRTPSKELARLRQIATSAANRATPGEEYYETFTPERLLTLFNEIGRQHENIKELQREGEKTEIAFQRARKERDEARGCLEAAEKLHQPSEVMFDDNDEPYQVCVNCTKGYERVRFPCDDLKTIRGH